MSSTAQAITEVPQARPAKSAASLANLRPWKAGESGNPNGRPPVFKEIRALAQAESPALFQTLIDMAKDTTKKDQVRIAAIKEVLKVAGVAVIDVNVSATGGPDGAVAAMSTRDLLAALRGQPPIDITPVPAGPSVPSIKKGSNE